MGIVMKNRTKTLLALSASTLLLVSCQAGLNPDSLPSSVASDSSEAAISESASVDGSSEDSREKWDEEEKALLLKYCGEVLPYPSGFLSYVSLNETVDDEGTPYLEIVNFAEVFTIGDYYKDLEKEGWSAVCDYNGNVAQTASSGTVYYELTHISEDGKTGYDLTYYFYSTPYTNDPCNVIQCYNDMDVDADSSTDWKKSTKEGFEKTLTIVPAKLKLGASNEAYASTEDNFAAYDTCAKNFTKDNVKILQDDGWTLNDEMSKERASWVLMKKATDGAPVYASVYYFFGNRISFTYSYEIHESATWPSEFVSSFEKTTGFTIPKFSADDIKKYYYCTKKGVNYVYADTDDDLTSDYEALMAETTAVFDNYYRWYTDWSETWYLKAEMTTDYANYERAFRISFATIEAPYDDVVTGWPSEKINAFLSNNGLNGVNVPSFDFSSYSAYQTCRVDVANYDDIYGEIYENIMDDPDFYDIQDVTDESEIAAKAEEIAKDETRASIKIFDGEKALDSAGNEIHKAYGYFASAFKKMGWAKAKSYVYDLAYEDSTGTVLIGLSHYLDTTTVTITHGSGSKHVADFRFENDNVNIQIGGSYALNIVCDLLVGEVTYSSDNEEFIVDGNGVVTASENARPGDSATITAEMLAEGETTSRTATAKVSIPLAYDSESAINKVASMYNDYFKLTSSDAGYAVPNANDDDSYTLTVKPTSLTTIEAAEYFVMNHLVPEDYGNSCDDKWSKETFKDGGTYETTSYIVCNDDEEATMFQLIFKVYADQKDGTIGIIVESLPY